MLKGRLLMHREFIELLERRSLERVKWTQDAWTNGTLTYLNHVNKNSERKIFTSIQVTFKFQSSTFSNQLNETRQFSRVKFISTVCNKLFIAHYLLNFLEGKIYWTLDLLYSFTVHTSGLIGRKKMSRSKRSIFKW